MAADRTNDRRETGIRILRQNPLEYAACLIMGKDPFNQLSNCSDPLIKPVPSRPLRPSRLILQTGIRDEAIFRHAAANR
jgi:hypothetical protein